MQAILGTTEGATAAQGTQVSPVVYTERAVHPNCPEKVQRTLCGFIRLNAGIRPSKLLQDLALVPHTAHIGPSMGLLLHQCMVEVKARSQQSVGNASMHAHAEMLPWDDAQQTRVRLN